MSGYFVKTTMSTDAMLDEIQRAGEWDGSYIYEDTIERARAARLDAECDAAIATEGKDPAAVARAGEAAFRKAVESTYEHRARYILNDKWDLEHTGYHPAASSGTAKATKRETSTTGGRQLVAAGLLLAGLVIIVLFVLGQMG